MDVHDSSMVHFVLVKKKQEVKRFMPVAIFAAFLMVLYNLVAHNQNHWIIKESILHVRCLPNSLFVSRKIRDLSIS